MLPDRDHSLSPRGLSQSALFLDASVSSLWRFKEGRQQLRKYFDFADYSVDSNQVECVS